jgi:hypothetical protein
MMNKDDLRMVVSDDINYFRTKAQFYKTHRLVEAARYAENLASNLELALMTLPSDEDPEIA